MIIITIYSPYYNLTKRFNTLKNIDERVVSMYISFVRSHNRIIQDDIHIIRLEVGEFNDVAWSPIKRYTELEGMVNSKTMHNKIKTIKPISEYQNKTKKEIVMNRN